MAEVKGGDKSDAYLAELSKRFGDKTLRVGFLENATYPADDSGRTEHVATVAAIQNYGAPSRGIPPRPFFRDMIQSNYQQWGPQLGKLLSNGANTETAFDQMGFLMSDQLRISIRNTNEPPLSVLTLMARKAKMKGNKITGSYLGTLASERRKGPPDLSGVSTKPLIDTGVMIGAVDFDVK